MLIKNGLVFTSDYQFARLDIFVEGDIIKQISAPGTISSQLIAGEEIIDADGAYVLPGFVDIHTHGCMNSDFCDADGKGIEKMLEYYGRNGILSVVPATMSFSEPILSGVIAAAKPYFGKSGYIGVLRGVNMEGPFINVSKKGAQNSEYIIDPQLEMFNKLYDAAGGQIRFLDMAPELNGSLDFIKAVSDRVAVSIAHTNADYDTAAEAFDAGARHVTHLFNAMPPFGHREPGVIGAASDKAAHVEIISDGFHLHPSVVRSVFKWFGDERVCLVSDSMRATGMPDGDYDLGGQPVVMKAGKATLTDGTLAGSATNLADCCRRAIGFGVPMEQAVRAASANNAEAAGISDIVGSIDSGKRADLLIWDMNLSTKQVIAGGVAVR